MGFCWKPCSPQWRWCVPECQPHVMEIPTCESMIIAEIAQRGVGNVAGFVSSGSSSSQPPFLFSPSYGSPTFGDTPWIGGIPGGGFGGGGGNGGGNGLGVPGVPGVVVPDPTDPSIPSRDVIPEPSSWICFVGAVLVAWILLRWTKCERLTE